MKNRLSFILLLLAALTVSLSSCQREEELSGTGLPSDVTLSVAIPSGINVKSAENPGDGTLVNRCILEIYENGTLVGEPHYADIAGLQATFSVRLVTGRSYDFVFWADCAEGSATEGFTDVYYNTADGLADITLIPEAYINSNDGIDAFYGSYNETIEEGGALSFTLYRPFGQVNLYTLDVNALPAGTDLTGAVARVSYAEIPAGFNALEETISTERIAIAPAEFAEVNFPAVGQAPEDGVRISFDYIFASPNEDETLVNFTLELDQNGQELCADFEASNIPVRRNYRTNVRGNFLTKGMDITVDINPGFNEPDNEVLIEDSEVADNLVINSLESADITYDSFTINYSYTYEGTDPITETGVSYRPAGSDAEYISVPAELATNAEPVELSVTVYGLEPGTEYEIVCYFVINGERLNSEPVTVATTEAVAPDYVLVFEGITLPQSIAFEGTGSSFQQLFNYTYPDQVPGFGYLYSITGPEGWFVDAFAGTLTIYPTANAVASGDIKAVFTSSEEATEGELLNEQVLFNVSVDLPVEYFFTVADVTSPVSFEAAQSQVFTYTTNTAQELEGITVAFTVPEGWSADAADGSLTVTAPADENSGVAEGSVSVTFTDAEGVSVYSADLFTVSVTFSTGGGEDPAGPNIGDYYYSDGTWSTNLNASKTVVGVVFWTGDPTANDSKLAADHPECTNGLVVALNAINNVAWGVTKSGADWMPDPANCVSIWAESNISYEQSLAFNQNISSTLSDDHLALNRNKHGYANTQTLLAFNEANPDLATLAQYISTYSTSAPEGTSGWFIPSVNEFTLFLNPENEAVAHFGPYYNGESFDHVDNLSTLLQNAGGASLAADTWLSNEVSVGSTNNALFAKYWRNDEYCYKSNSKADSFDLRLILAF
ncbi:MAG TPA: fibronectin type III domain-containing protein [Candidatus Coprenecus pullistercoris]|nr:fibronectin type III domain-containing protein [Candidatus Coprenecus pullistercoris]